MDITGQTVIIDTVPREQARKAERSHKSLWDYIRSDLDRYRVTDERSYLTVLILSSETLACIVYRWGHWVWCYKGHLSWFVRLQRPLYIFINRIVEIVSGVVIRPRAEIGEGLYIVHGGSVRIGADVVLGDNCNIAHEVTIGVGGRGDKRGSPILGDRVFIAPGAKLFGAIRIGDDVAIGANAVVTKSLPDRAVAVGIPAKVISYEGSFEFVFYNGMDHDQERLRSLGDRETSRSNASAE